MTDIEISEQLEDLFQKTGNAHHKTFIKTDGEDPEWPLWYADYLLEKLGKLLNAKFTKSELVYLLVMVEKERAMMAPGSNWPTYYANFFIERYL
ncbi:MAG: hypothetical protein HYW01_10535 [Deltaproteobacteria bacterium]|nr:hypothetical protein [Deltaproteobacteria bacterium]